MCCLFGMIDYRGHFTGRQKTRLLSVLAAECEARGTDAAGVAYCAGGALRVYKRPVPAHALGFRIPDGVSVVLGHTRMTTQGSQEKNYNNHPFLGNAGGRRFALAHNGVLYNDQLLRTSLRLPSTKIETDSYVAVQLLERQKALDFASLKYMAEQVEGSFTFTLMDEANRWYLVKGDNPLCLYHYPRLGVYLYASTEEILRKALRKQGLGRPKRIAGISWKSRRTGRFTEAPLRRTSGTGYRRCMRRPLGGTVRRVTLNRSTGGIWRLLPSGTAMIPCASAICSTRALHWTM